MFEGFTRGKANVGDATINYVTAGKGPPLLLLHGAPQTLAMWSLTAPLLTDRFTVVCPDLRGYGDSSKPKGAPDHANYTFRVMAADQVGLMKHLGFERFHVAGHDRGGRVTHRMALDSPQAVRSLSMLDIVPTLDMYEGTNLSFATKFWLWFFLPLPEPISERMIGADPDFFFETLLGRYGGTGLEAFDAEALAEYRRCWRDPAMIHGMCSDYRAGLSRDLELDRADLGRKIAAPTLVLWAADGLMGKQFDFPALWKARCSNVQFGTVPGGHFFPDQSPKETAAALAAFFLANP